MRTIDFCPKNLEYHMFIYNEQNAIAALMSKLFFAVLSGAALLSVSACQPPPQIIINANSSADRTNTDTETEANHSETSAPQGQSPTVIATAPTPTAPAASANPAVQTESSFGTCYWNGAPEQCTAQWSGQTVSVRWASDGKVTRYDFNAGTVFDTANGKTYQATQVDLAQGCMSTANGRTCIYR